MYFSVVLLCVWGGVISVVCLFTFLSFKIKVLDCTTQQSMTSMAEWNLCYESLWGHNWELINPVQNHAFSEVSEFQIFSIMCY